MIHLALRFIEVVAVLGAFSACAFYLVCVAGALGFLRSVKNEADVAARPAPPVSILKPLKGTDPGMYENLRSHCLQEYPEFEILFGVSDANDPALKYARQLQAEFPAIAIRVVVCQRALGTNVKVSNLAQMLQEARYEHVVVNDSDIRVGRDYLNRVVPPLNDPRIGLVTCLYRGVPSPSLGSRFESLFISTDFCAGVVAAQLVEGGIHFGLGSTLAFRRADLAAAGGFEALADYLADDYELGRRIAGLGLRVKLSETVVETYLPRYDFSTFFIHQIRWARTIRDSRPGGYLGLVATFGIPWALIALLCAGGAAWSWALLAAAAILRFLAAAIVGRVVLRDRQVLRSFALIPLRDVVGVLVWLVGFRGNAIEWRGDSFALKDGKLVRTGS